MLAWYIASRSNFNLDINLVIKYALTHDIIETYAGDTYIYDSKSVATKRAREHAAAQKLAQTFPDFNELHALIKVYEDRADRESRFVYALDKIVPVIILYLGNGKGWHQHNVTLKMLHDTKDKQIKQSQELGELWNELTARLANQPELFPDVS